MQRLIKIVIAVALASRSQLSVKRVGCGLVADVPAASWCEQGTEIPPWWVPAGSLLHRDKLAV